MTHNRMSLFCLVDGEATSHAFSIKIPSSDTVDDLKKLIKIEIPDTFNGVDAKDLTLWRVSIPITEDDEIPILLNDISDEDKKKLGPATRLSKVFPEDLPDETVLIIVHRPPLKTRIMDLIKNIKGQWGDPLHSERRLSGSVKTLPNMMPYLERDTEKAINRVVKNVTACLSREPTLQPAKSESAFLVCCGTAGIGKTRFGRELFGALKDKLSSRYEASRPAKDRGLDTIDNFKYSPKHLYLLLDFNNGLKLDADDRHLTADIILGLRLAYLHFFEGRYGKRFPDFRLAARDSSQSFTIAAVIDAIREDLKLPEGTPLFLFLHIDEYQSVFSYEWEGIPVSCNPPPKFETGKAGKLEVKGEGIRLFREMMRCLGSVMAGEVKPSMIQTFLSGTARQEVSRLAKPTFYSFDFFECPTLSLGACYEIMSYFVDKANAVSRSDWMPKMAYFHLLSATGGLPRALQLLLEDIFGTKLEHCADFKEELNDVDKNAERIFIRVANELDTRYKVRSFVKTHKEVFSKLLRLYILETPKPRNYVPVSSCPFEELTLEDLERDTHTILEDCDDDSDDVLVRIPYFFLHIYNGVTNVVQNCLGTAFAQNWKRREWRFFEDIVAEYETLRTNLLIADGTETSTLGGIYKGALGRKETLDRTVKLRTLLPPVKADHWFPRTSLTIRGGQEQDWRSNIVIMNCDGAPFADVCVYRESADNMGDNVLCALQAKKWEAPVTPTNFNTEHDKNRTAFKKLRDGSTLGEQGIKRERVITVLVTTADIHQSLLQQLKSESCPDDCLVIYQGNFADFFGEAFAIHAALAASWDQNWNFATRETLKKKHTLDDGEQILDNMPYHSYDDLIQKVPSLASKDLDKNVGFLPYQVARPKRRRLE
ncbi:hypothetical protein BGZ81_000252 [Podila clonocystis]|nr:hypothetical protein BGZ81_000252 [Podila clonocystis]